MTHEEPRFINKNLVVVWLLCWRCDARQVEHTKTGECYALKALSKGYVLKTGMQKSVMSEKDVQLMCDSVFIVKLSRGSGASPNPANPLKVSLFIDSEFGFVGHFQRH